MLRNEGYAPVPCHVSLPSEPPNPRRGRHTVIRRRSASIRVLEDPPCFMFYSILYIVLWYVLLMFHILFCVFSSRDSAIAMAITMTVDTVTATTTVTIMITTAITFTVLATRPWSRPQPRQWMWSSSRLQLRSQLQLQPGYSRGHCIDILYFNLYFILHFILWRPLRHVRALLSSAGREQAHGLRATFSPMRFEWRWRQSYGCAWRACLASREGTCLWPWLRGGEGSGRGLWERSRE